MKTIAVEHIDLASMQKRYRYSVMALIFAIFLVVISGISLVLMSMQLDLPGDDLLPHITVFITACVGAFWAFQASHWARSDPHFLDTRSHNAWLFITFGLLALGARGLVENTMFDPPTGHFLLLLRYAIFCLFYPCLFIGIRLLPGTSPLRASMIVDTLITTCCLAGIFWYFFTITLNLPLPVGIGFSDWLFRLRLALLSISGDVFLLLVLLLYLQHCANLHIRRSIWILGGGLVFTILGDIGCSWHDISFTPSVPENLWANLAWIIGALLIGLSTLYQYNIQVRAYVQSGENAATVGQEGAIAIRGQRLHWFHVQSMYVPLAFILGGLCIIEVMYLHWVNNEAVNSLFVLSSVVGMLIVTRHLFATRENEALLRERDQRLQEAEQVRYLVTQLSDILELDALRERILNVLITQFGFTSAMVVLLEEYDQPLSEHSHLIVSTGSRLVNTLNYRIAGDTILYRLVADRKECELLWNVHANELPSELRHWQERQHIPSMHFFPIIYQGKILGSLGVARHVLSRSDALMASIIRSYADQIAIVIEHAYLYQDVQGREKFARAMVNISTILNAAAMEPIEISQLICAEGSNALHADYVAFYTRRAEGLLEPLAVTMPDQLESSDLLTDWPTLRIAEYEQETAQPLHPFLLEVGPSRRTQPSSESGAQTALSRDQQPGSRQFALRAKLIRHRIYTAILAPLVTGGRLNGLLIFARSVPLGSNSDLSFDEADIANAQDFVEQASVAFTNAQLYQSLSSANEQLKELDKMKDQFMITASHELRTPLTAVQGYIELIAQYDEVLPKEQRQEFLQRAQMGCEELAILLHNVMDASRIEAEAAIKPALIKRVSVKNMLDKVMIMIEPQVTHDQRQVICDVSPQFYVYADPLRLHQVLMNISTNALKYSPAGTPITFSAAYSTEQETAVVISVTDKGKGIAPQDQPRLFQRFYRLESDMNSPVRGSGLGLYISRRLIEAMGGKIWIESRGIPGGGSTFHILLPMAR
ncbi:hypothetical protein KDA_27370 [Dictyobacter alpinus]|uniref:histidine kinase n=1 Tax=Dictyobacter alpinus TaxID=2014873 RepID=A0A402B785_9CHLR|nr:GAF domain-containing sensor histidine kinase [Dictyobacter alpinus]GCE27253.1 hypothetical protein KDA_27370 [Dictyobacter alpinus]